ncbi:DUF368 domain-containing protein [Aquimarina agarivorans]|uniref:DUF368 domain-containing protein n=1 Tax=Aquimarina agarivorans TaxID=980584 RepID=UPI000248EDA2|nr:DUF368 domain-containing protein [Aquimarina agarivorans]
MPQSTRTLVDKILLVLKGLAMGAANKVPGVSGGVVAFVAGFYEEFIYSLQKINFKAFKLLINFRWASFFQYINGSFLGLLIAGMLISYFSVSKILDYFLVTHELYVWSLFFGMIIGSVIYIARTFKNWNSTTLSFLIGGTLAGIAISLLPPSTQNDNLIFVFFCGIIGVSGMTLPGLSGSFILILLGNYVLLLVDSVNTLFDTFLYVFNNDFSFLNNAKHMRLLTVLIIFSIGSLVGMVSLSHLLGFVLKKFKNQTFASIIGFILGSLGVVWPWKNKIFKLDTTNQLLMDNNSNAVLDHYERYLPALNSATFIALLWIIVGIGVVLYLDYVGNKTSKI